MELSIKCMSAVDHFCNNFWRQSLESLRWLYLQRVNRFTLISCWTSLILVSATKKGELPSHCIGALANLSLVFVLFHCIEEGKFIHHRMFRDSCLSVEGNFLKDLTILGRDLSKAVLVDNSPHVFGYQVDNGIPIESWFDDPHDKELLKLEMFLRTLHGVDDVRDVLRKTFQTQRLVRNA